MSTLVAQRQRLIDEVSEAFQQLDDIRKMPYPDLKLLNYYNDLISRNQLLLQMLEDHLPPLSASKKDAGR
ncbi:MAG: hypothetical protein H6999_07125 [Hahellaceae bacterium]|nr:hypothetical protein [Hahellaceae bacterium]